jgi:transposase-like protein
MGLCWVGREVVRRRDSTMRTTRPSRQWIPPRSAFAGFRFPSDVIVLAVRWCLRFGLSYRDVEELLTERGVEVDHVTVYRWVRRFTPLLADAARRDAMAARRFFAQAVSATEVTPMEVTTDQPPVYPAVLEDLLPAAWHRTDQYANNRIECDHGRLKARHFTVCHSFSSGFASTTFGFSVVGR